jgi:hypothetical protein
MLTTGSRPAPGALEVLGLVALACGILASQPIAKGDEKPQVAKGSKEKAAAVSPKKPKGGKVVGGLVALAELVEQPGRGSFEVRLSLKNVSDKPITVCDCLHFCSQVQVQWTGPDGKRRTSKHNNYPGSNFLLNKGYFVGIPPGGTRRIAPTIRFHTAAAKPGPDGPVDRTLGYFEQLDRMGLAGRSNLVTAGEHRVTVSFTNMTTSYPAGRGPQGGPSRTLIPVANVWTGTVTAKEVTFKVK